MTRCMRKQIIIRVTTILVESWPVAGDLSNDIAAIHRLLTTAVCVSNSIPSRLFNQGSMFLSSFGIGAEHGRRGSSSTRPTHLSRPTFIIELWSSPFCPGHLPQVLAHKFVSVFSSRIYTGYSQNPYHRHRKQHWDYWQRGSLLSLRAVCDRISFTFNYIRLMVLPRQLVPDQKMEVQGKMARRHESTRRMIGLSEYNERFICHTAVV